MLLTHFGQMLSSPFVQSLFHPHLSISTILSSLFECRFVHVFADRRYLIVQKQAVGTIGTFAEACEDVFQKYYPYVLDWILNLCFPSFS